MTRKIYKTAMGKDIDMGALVLQHEHVRAIGNMNVNARGDQLDSSNKVTNQKNRQVQRQYQKTFSNVSTDPVYSGTLSAQSAKNSTNNSEVRDNPLEILDQIEKIEPVVAPEPLPDNTFGPTGEGGLAAAIARSRVIKQEKEKTLRERQQEQGLRKI
jgi:hypothetical protein